jgi:D-ornithine/D-lysine decarboxylase
MDGIDLATLAERTGTPHYVYSEKKLRANAAGMLKAFSNVHSNTTIAYASKALANMSVLKILREEGLGIEVNSGGELFKVMQAGFIGDQIIFNGVAKTKVEIEAAIAARIKAINVDSLSELKRVIECAKHSPYPANVALRVVPEIQGGGTAGLETGSASSKFGMTSGEIMIALEKIRAASDVIEFKGFHAHIGSQVNNLSAYRAESAFMIRFLTDIKASLPGTLKHLNLGGGFPISYIGATNTDANPSHLSETYTAALGNDDVATALIAPLRDTFGPDLELIVEPGRSLVADTAVLLTRVEAMKKRNDLSWLYLDAGYGIMLDAVFSWYFHMVTANRTEDEETARFRVFGPLCDSYDAFFDVAGEAAITTLLKKEPSLSSHRDLLEDVLLHQPGLKELPARTTVGDIIAALDVGAYNIDTQSQYCGRLQPAVSLVGIDGKVQEIRRAETTGDLLARDR